MRLFPLILTAVAIGVIFRFSNLSGTIYSSDEAFTGLFATGHNPVEAGESIFTGQVITAQQVQEFQRYDSSRGISSTIASLAIHDPQHPPLYYVLSRWMLGWFPNTVVATRLVAALAGVALIPAVYFLALELFQSNEVAAISAALIAASPFHQIYAQEAREYSLWACLIIISTLSLLKAVKKKSLSAWMLYSLTLIAGLYTFLFTLLVVASHTLYVVYRSKLKDLALIRNYCLSTLVSLLAFYPWLTHIGVGKDSNVAAAGWTSTPMSFPGLLRSWVGHIKSLFFDLDLNVSTYSSYNVLITLLSVALAAYAVFWGFKHMPRRSLICLITLGGVTLLLLLGADLFLGGRRSIVSRYWMPAYLSLQLLVAYCLGQNISLKKGRARRFWQSALAIILSIGLLSGAVFVRAETWANKRPSQLYPEVARIIRSAPNSLVINSHANARPGKLVSLCTLLPPDQAILAFNESDKMRSPDSFSPISRFSRAFAFELSKSYKAALTAQGYVFTPVYKAADLWKLEKPD
ncbi:glycosyltransferase family 39 protein [Leptolyngbya sp. BC1307]|uniref:glycosyltransferase family 39 protein n=1 Tax=Leptolyngbya sp. BC1307 TaxID=2029589 RepID=UPI000EFAAB87|nr:glycosyltransferase family 39 protein [Leptolyngbya sp. BC1307]